MISSEEKRNIPMSTIKCLIRWRFLKSSQVRDSVINFESEYSASDIVRYSERDIVKELTMCTAGSSGVKLVTRQALFDMMQEQDSNFEAKLVYMENYILNLFSISEDQKRVLKPRIARLKSEFRKKWLESSRTVEKFLISNKNWLQGAIEIPKPASIQVGRPSKAFEDLCDRSKRRKTENLRKNVSLDELSYATKVELYASGKRDASRVLSDLTSTPTRATKYKQAFKKEPTELQKLSSRKALAMFVEADLSRNQYVIIRNANMSSYPCYSLVQRAKRECYPKKEDMTVTESIAEIKLQSNLDLTVNRLLLSLEDVLESLSEVERNSLMLVCKWGCDGSHQYEYKQKFENEDGSDAAVFQSSYVPLRLICETNSKIIWQNPTPSSPRYCRPIRIRFLKETTEVIKEEIKFVKDATNTLLPTKSTVNNKEFNVKHTMMLTMVDGKVCNAATGNTSTMKCYICFATSKDFNKLNIEKEVHVTALSFGLSILHARIRIFENIIHLSYKLTLEQWRVSGELEKAVVKERKTFIQAELKKRMGLIVDVPKPGFGNSNDGNTSRRFFADPELAAEITGVDLNLILRLKVILETLSSGFKIDTEKLKIYTKETAELYVKLYDWYPMTPTLHKILMHSSVVVDHVLLPLGQLSEEAVEARNKHLRLYRQNFSRKFSRQACNTDVLNRLLINSDPLITGLRKIRRKTSEPFMSETMQMLLPEDVLLRGETIDESRTSDEEIFSDSE